MRKSERERIGLKKGTKNNRAQQTPLIPKEILSFTCGPLLKLKVSEIILFPISHVYHRPTEQHAIVFKLHEMDCKFHRHQVRLVKWVQCSFYHVCSLFGFVELFNFTQLWLFSTSHSFQFIPMVNINAKWVGVSWWKIRSNHSKLSCSWWFFMWHVIASALIQRLLSLGSSQIESTTSSLNKINGMTWIYVVVAFVVFPKFTILLVRTKISVVKSTDINFHRKTTPMFRYYVRKPGVEY